MLKFIYIYIYIYIENQQSPISPPNSVYFVNFYRGFIVLTDFQENINIATIRYNVTSGVTSSISNVTFSIVKKWYRHSVSGQ